MRLLFASWSSLCLSMVRYVAAWCELLVQWLLPYHICPTHSTTAVRVRLLACNGITLHDSWSSPRDIDLLGYFPGQLSLSVHVDNFE